jgi:hypothetical protein
MGTGASTTLSRITAPDGLKAWFLDHFDPGDPACQCHNLRKQVSTSASAQTVPVPVKPGEVSPRR